MIFEWHKNADISVITCKKIGYSHISSRTDSVFVFAMYQFNSSNSLILVNHDIVAHLFVQWHEKVVYILFLVIFQILLVALLEWDWGSRGRVQHFTLASLPQPHLSSAANKIRKVTKNKMYSSCARHCTYVWGNGASSYWTDSLQTQSLNQFNTVGYCDV